MRRGMSFGVALNGVPFDPGTAEYWQNDRRSGWRYEALSGKINLGLDQNNAHVQPNGAYHYHGLPKGMLTSLSPDAHSPLVGYAADGFPIYALYGYSDPKDPSKGIKQLRSGWRLKSGTRPDGPGGRYDGSFVNDWQYDDSAGDLNESNARFTVTPEYPDGTFAYFLTEGFPLSRGLLSARPTAVFAKARQVVEGMAVGRAFTIRVPVISAPAAAATATTKAQAQAQAQGHLTSGGSDIRMASTLPPVFRPKIVPRSWSKLYSTYRPRRIS